MFTPLKNSLRRKIALAAWNKPSDPTIYFQTSFDATKCLQLIEKINQTSQTPITITHVVTKILALTFKKNPRANGIIKRGKVYLRNTIDMHILVALPQHNNDHDQHLSGVTIKNCDQKSLLEIAEETSNNSLSIRQGNDKTFGTGMSLFRFLPSWIIKLLFRISGWLSYDLGFSWPATGLLEDPFGTAMISNIGSLGLPVAFVPLVQFTRHPLILCIGKITPKPWAIDNKVEVRPVLDISITLDHRFMDGTGHAKLFTTFEAIFLKCDELT